MAKRPARPRSPKGEKTQEMPEAASPADPSSTKTEPPEAPACSERDELLALEAAVRAAEQSLARREAALESGEKELAAREALVRVTERELSAREVALDRAGDGLALLDVAERATADELVNREAILQAAQQDLHERRTVLEAIALELADRESAANSGLAALAEREQRAQSTERALHVRYETLVGRESDMAGREQRMAEREAAVAIREERLVLREAAVIASERDLQGRREASTARERDLHSRTRQLDARDEELAIREAAVDEAMSLASETIDTRPAASLLSEAEEFLEGPDMSAPALSAAEVELEGMRQAEEQRRKVEEQRAAEEQRRVLDEAEQLLLLTRQIPALALLEPRVQKAMAASLNFTVITAFYNMAVRSLADPGRGETGERAEKLQATLEERQKALDDANGLIASLKEDFARYRNRTKTEQETFVARANEELLRKIVPVADNFDRALSAAAGASNVDAVLSGVKLIQRQFEDFLAQEGLVPIKATGLPFDPRVHEALMEVETAEVPDDTVYEEIQRGYYLGGKVFRPALVKVARTPAGAKSVPASER